MVGNPCSVLKGYFCRNTTSMCNKFLITELTTSSVPCPYRNFKKKCIGCTVNYSSQENVEVVEPTTTAMNIIVVVFIHEDI